MLEINNLSVGYQTTRGMVRAVNQASFRMNKGEIIGLVGESGCGKSTVFFSIMGLLPSNSRLLEGQILLDGRDISRLSSKNWLNIRGREISMIFQDPMTTLNPAYPIGKQIMEIILAHESRRFHFAPWEKARYRACKERVLQLMHDVGIPDPEKRYHNYPHQLSGGMQQRILIAIALACEPKLLLADEPTTALDVTIQAQILDLLKKINRERGTSILLITHDLGVASEFCDSIAVMYAGRIVEYGPADVILRNPAHPYTKGLLGSIPVIRYPKKKIRPIRGSVIDLTNIGDGCAFFDRCDCAQDCCRKPPVTTQLPNNHQVMCWQCERSPEYDGCDD